jgi:transmembrane sensor
MFSGSERNVEVSGEVYFEVAKNAAKPFKVNFNGNTITVLGTHFNVMAYPEEAKSKVTLLEGSVKLSNTTGNAMLKPGMQALVKDANSAITTQKANIEAAVAWKNGYFLFDNENIQSIMRKISRWYDVDVAYQGEMTGKEFSGSISRFENVSEVLGMLELTGSIHFNLRERRIKVMP